MSSAPSESAEVGRISGLVARHCFGLTAEELITIESLIRLEEPARALVDELPARELKLRQK